MAKNLSFCGSFRPHEVNNTCCFQMQSRASQITPWIKAIAAQPWRPCSDLQKPCQNWTHSMSICHSSSPVGKGEGELGESLNCVDPPAWVMHTAEKQQRDFPKVMVRGKDQQLRPPLTATCMSGTSTRIVRHTNKFKSIMFFPDWLHLLRVLLWKVLVLKGKWGSVGGR